MYGRLTCDPNVFLKCNCHHPNFSKYPDISLLGYHFQPHAQANKLPCVTSFRHSSEGAAQWIHVIYYPCAAIKIQGTKYSIIRIRRYIQYKSEDKKVEKPSSSTLSICFLLPSL
ncbi:hypothetical protein XELAEV_18037913mg [Xenopus laevis]|uniref:Uncharacterized protein n=1 Tax=Xenopus laevis TaxID=8355 RepID=A0A974HAN5_XENLA|nr:hypothetical protein XELAEV_18037913mg [Xenopus laevis]